MDATLYVISGDVKMNDVFLIKIKKELYESVGLNISYEDIIKLDGVEVVLETSVPSVELEAEYYGCKVTEDWLCYYPTFIGLAYRECGNLEDYHLLLYVVESEDEEEWY